jgi:hypothetical protein
MSVTSDVTVLESHEPQRRSFFACVTARDRLSRGRHV